MGVLTCFNTLMIRMQYQLGKLLLQPSKPTESLEIFVAPEEMVVKSNLGQLFILVEIKSREKGIKEKIRQIVDLIKNDYYSSPVLDIESSLESTCQNLNLNLPEIISKPEVWYKKIHILVGVTRDNILTFTQLGLFSGYLIRNNKITQILNSQPQEKQDNFFSQLTTGEVKGGDVVIFSTLTLLDFFSLEKIKEIALKLSPEQAVQQFKNLIAENIKIPNVLSLIIKYERKLTEVDEKRSQTRKYLQELYGSQESMEQLENLKQRTGRTLSASNWPNLGKIKTIFVFKNKKPKDKKDLKLPQVKFKKTCLSALVPVRAVANKTKSLFRSLAKDKLIAAFQNIQPNLKFNFKKFNIIGIIIILVVVFIGSLIYLKYDQQVKKEIAHNQNILNQVEDKKSQAKAALIYQDEEKANNLLNQALEILNTLPQDDEKWQKQFKIQQQEIIKLINKVNNIFEVRPEILVNLSTINIGGIKEMVKNSDQLYVLAANGNIYKILPQEKSFSLFFEKDNLKTLASWEGDSFILFSQDGKFYFKNKQEEKMLNISLPADSQVNDIEVYANKIYVLGKTMIYKISRPLSATPRVINWYQDKEDLIKAAKQMIIDGYIWLINEQGKIVKLFKGKKVDFELTKLDKDLGAHLRIYTELDWNLLYILDRQNGRLLLTNKDGLVEKQFIAQSLNEAENLIISDNQNYAWFNIKDQIYQINLKEE